MQRREFIAGLGSAASWSLAVRAQQSGPMRRVGVLMVNAEHDPEGAAWLSGFTQGLAELGWVDGRNLRTEIRWGASNTDRLRILAKELVDLRPEVILAASTQATSILQQRTRTIPIVFTVVVDPIGAGFVDSLPHPGGNITGFINIEAAMSGKWLEFLTKIAPGIKRAAMMFNPDTAPAGGLYFQPSFEAAAQSLKVEPITAPVHSDTDIERVITALGREPASGLILPADPFLLVHRAAIIMLPARHKVPATYINSKWVRDGALFSYGPNIVDIFRRSAAYVDRILRGSKPADLPVQLPTKFEMAVNLKTAKALGLAMPQSILLSADEVIE
jgi:putative tryptophan/tyrosine transport system substrate-binding protein